MGYYVEFYLFDKKPSITKLKSVKALKSWRLYKQTKYDLYFLVAQTDSSDVLFDPPQYIAKNLGARANIRADLFKLCKDSVKLACLLSENLDQSVFWLAGDDEDLDAAVICEKGQLKTAKILTDWNKEAQFDNGQWTENTFYPEDSDPDDAPARMIHQNLTEMVCSSITKASDWILPEFPTDAEFTLLSERGERPVKKVPKDRFKNMDPNPVYKQVYRAIDPFIAESLKIEKITADRSVRNEMLEDVHACLFLMTEFIESRRYNSNLDTPDMKKIQSLHELFGDIIDYYFKLKPSPEFRKNYDFKGINANLRKRFKKLSPKKRFGIFG